MVSVQERVMDLVGRLPDPEAEALERFLLSRVRTDDAKDWQDLAAAAFGAWYDDKEYEYPADAGRPR